MMEGISESAGMDIKKENEDESLNIIKDVINSEVSFFTFLSQIWEAYFLCIFLNFQIPSEINDSSIVPDIKHEQNPWSIHSIYELQYFNCPTCMFRNHSKQAFIDHAYEYHPEAVAALSNIEDGSLSDINCPWTSELDSKEIKTESQNTNATEESSGEYFEYSMDLDYEN